jgi:cytochrome c553
MDGVLEMNQDLTLFPDAGGLSTPYFGIADFCVRCHNRDHQQPGFEIPFDHWRDPLVAAEDNHRHIDKHGRRAAGGGTYGGLRPGYRYPAVVACTDCHTMHGTDNAGLLIDRAAKGASRLDPPLAARVVVNQGNYAQLCVLCHDMERPAQDYWRDTGNGLHGVHRAEGDCRPCHQHGQPNQPGL